MRVLIGSELFNVDEESAGIVSSTQWTVDVHGRPFAFEKDKLVFLVAKIAGVQEPEDIVFLDGDPSNLVKANLRLKEAKRATPIETRVVALVDSRPIEREWSSGTRKLKNPMGLRWSEHLQKWRVRVGGSNIAGSRDFKTALLFYEGYARKLQLGVGRLNLTDSEFAQLKLERPDFHLDLTLEVKLRKSRKSSGDKPKAVPKSCWSELKNCS